MEALLISGGSLTDVSQDETMDTRVCFCSCCSSRDRPLSLPAGSRRLERWCQCIAAGLLLVVLTVPICVALTSYLTPCTQESSLADSDTEYVSPEMEKLQMRREEHPRAMLTAPNGDISVGDRLRWQTKLGRAFCRGGFQYSDGILTVPVDGHFHLMLQVTYQYHPNVTCGRTDRNIKLFNKVLLYHHSYPRDQHLISVLDTVSCDLQYWEKSLHVSRLVYLEANSKLKVSSSHASLIVKAEQSTFFGVEWLPA